MYAEVSPVFMFDELVSQKYRNAPVPTWVKFEKATQKLRYF